MADDTFGALLAQRAFMRIWGARLLSTAGSQMLMVAIGWQMYDLTASAWDLGLVGLFQFVPAFVMALPAGHAADRWHRRTIVTLCLVLQAVVCGVLMAAFLQHWATRELLLAVSVALGVARAFQQPAQQALLPMLVPTALLARAMAFGAAGTQAAVISGPAIGGAIFAAGAQAVYGCCGALFVAGCLLSAWVRVPRIPGAREPASFRTALAGLAFIYQRKPVLGAISLDLFAVLFGGAVALLPIFAKDILHTGPLGLGLLRGAPAVGALVVSVALTRWPLRRHVGRTLLTSVGLYGACIVVFGLSTSFWLSLVVLAVSGGADMVSVVIRHTLVQMETPDAMRGRVAAVNSLFIGASNQLGEFESGATAAWFGPVGAVVVGGVATLAIALGWRWLFPALAQRDRLN
jgi:MFS family permease